MHRLDDSFKKRRIDSRLRRRWRLTRSFALGLLALVLAGGGLYWAFQSGLVTIGRQQTVDPVSLEADSSAPVVDETPSFAPAFVDLAGDPMRINFGALGGSASKLKAVDVPADFPQGRGTGGVELLIDTMIDASQRLMITLPSGPDDFAFYQAQRGSPLAASAPIQVASLGADVLSSTGIDAGGGWGETLDGEQAALPEVTQTRIANTTSIAFLRPESSRVARGEDFIVRVLIDRNLASLVQESGFSEAEGQKAQVAMETLLGTTQLAAGDLVALRGETGGSGSGMSLVQLSLYHGSTYVGTLARASDGVLTMGVDPWVDDDLVSYSTDSTQIDSVQQYRLLDAVYSAAIRNGVPTGVTGEAIMLLSRSFDLNAFVDPMDQLVLAYSEQGEPGDLSRILYAAITGPSRHIECFVYRPASGDYSCFDPGSAKGAAVSGMFTPVNGVMTSGFGPRMHPIFKVVRVHKGVDWAAPIGTPVMAAFAGKVLSAGTAGGYGNMVQLAHQNGTETRYAHLSRFADGLAVGQQVAAGDLIGYVGTTGNSTGPHLHFEVYRAGEAIDPMSERVASAGGDVAVAALVDRIVAVESGGSATARNPLSSATGAGQFISATWLRMIRTYRRDLSQSLTEAEILELRNDPTISREMVTELARESESYLKSRQIEATAGRLYLAHFLGMEGAYKVLSASAETPLADFLAPSIFTANPFLVGQTAGYLINWADRKMAGIGSAAPVTRAARSDPAFNTYRDAVRSLVASASPTSD